MDKPTILVVDDDPVSLTLLSKLVEKLNYHVVKAVDGVGGLGVLKSHPVQLIVADYDMPRLNGLEMLKVVREDFSHIPFVLVTAYSNVKVIKEAWESGAFDFFQKPVFVDRLTETVHLAIEHGHLAIARRKFSLTEGQVPDPTIFNVGIVRELAAALDRVDLLQIVEEYEIHARIELEQILRFNMVSNQIQVRTIAHRLAGTSVNLGLVKIADELRAIEKRPQDVIRNPAEIQQILERSIYWLHSTLGQIFENQPSVA